ncbi:hypothetical protein COZ60_02335 [Candidatus Bathyarchaeota archaeon CG_4_8_14_3_um_filter_42_8]|nr:MAG: hypothetical protein COZ60_02335 [Candidatus Bathyarchaeota archaeon CG_4_8_14_3_um_filter_42_8]
MILSVKSGKLASAEICNTLTQPRTKISISSKLLEEGRMVLAKRALAILESDLFGESPLLDTTAPSSKKKLTRDDFHELYRFGMVELAVDFDNGSGAKTAILRVIAGEEMVVAEVTDNPGFANEISSYGYIIRFDTPIPLAEYLAINNLSPI